MSLEATDLDYGVPGRRLLDGAQIRVRPGAMHALLGPNGAGKSTLLRILAGELAPDRGVVSLNGRPLETWTPTERARQRAVLPQTHGLSFGFTASEVVALGRLPCSRRRASEERALVREALACAGAAVLAERKYPSLSGGEKARVQLARVLAQVWEPLDGSLAGRPRYLLLDEPTASLDLAHQHDCLHALREFAQRGVGVLVALHDPNLAFRYADEVTLLRDGRVLASGPPAETLTAEVLERLYRVPLQVLPAQDGTPPYIVVRERPPHSASR